MDIIYGVHYPLRLVQRHGGNRYDYHEFISCLIILSSGFLSPIYYPYAVDPVRDYVGPGKLRLPRSIKISQTDGRAFVWMYVIANPTDLMISFLFVYTDRYADNVSSLC